MLVRKQLGRFRRPLWMWLQALWKRRERSTWIETKPMLRLPNG
jgi:hypothetical protein